MTSNYFLPLQPKPPQGSVLEQLQPPPQPVAPRLEVFLSHATIDTEHVETVRQQIEALGISVYLAEHDPKPGTPLSQKVEGAIERSDAVIVLITTNSVNSAYVQQEVGIAHRCRKLLVPIVEKGIDTRQLGILQGIEYLELDLEHPAETMAKMTASLQPLVFKQLTAMNVSVISVNQTTSLDPAMALLLIGLGLMVGILLFAAVSSQGNGSA